MLLDYLVSVMPGIFAIPVAIVIVAIIAIFVTRWCKRPVRKWFAHKMRFMPEGISGFMLFMGIFIPLFSLSFYFLIMKPFAGDAKCPQGQLSFKMHGQILSAPMAYFTMPTTHSRHPVEIEESPVETLYALYPTMEAYCDGVLTERATGSYDSVNFRKNRISVFLHRNNSQYSLENNYNNIDETYKVTFLPVERAIIDETFLEKNGIRQYLNAPDSHGRNRNVYFIEGEERNIQWMIKCLDSRQSGDVFLLCDAEMMLPQKTISITYRFDGALMFHWYDLKVKFEEFTHKLLIKGGK